MVILGGFFFAVDFSKFLGECYVQLEPRLLPLQHPPGRGGVGVIRLSGPKSYAIAAALTQKDLPKARYAGFRQFYDACQWSGDG